ncbi:uncharacterized protein HMPREF1541_07850 [Cyphellophora europaea CBS 101466]|uniref:Methyltransferase domain-containing protein n=1 Tax=Cyphellophora europaea (strain CBS 101466) TaxID=1220924 RepID=W2RME9_CYPE1|nr:uncharacterized protein HMPREF1541_07850 [Cyphellophora europaea CBS 101466]ETN36863.1 hypothetical protein HMPREF1541_07850 [Cyphellophora europaea CBS 101466]
MTPDTNEAIAEIWQTETTETIRSSIFDYPIEHGRQYHAYKAGSYHRPNDEEELTRIDLVTVIFNLVNKGKMHHVPLNPSSNLRILDIGTGTGSWCIEMGDAYPAADITGIDLSASMPELVPPNVQFEIDDAEDPWTYDQPFDFIHSRYMLGAIRNWPGMVRQCFDNLTPGGYIELQDFDLDYYSVDGSLTPDHALKRWLTASYAAEEITGRTLRPGRQLEGWLKAAGFVNVQVIRTPIPLGPWPKDERQKRIGLLNWTQLWEGLPGLSLRLFIDVLGYTREELEILLMEVRKDMQSPSIHPMFDL